MSLLPDAMQSLVLCYAPADETAVRELEVSPTGQAYVVARANFEKLMNGVNEAIGAGMEKGATSSIITLA